MRKLKLWRACDELATIIQTSNGLYLCSISICYKCVQVLQCFRVESNNYEMSAQRNDRRNVKSENEKLINCELKKVEICGSLLVLKFWI